VSGRRGDLSERGTGRERSGSRGQARQEFYAGDVGVMEFAETGDYRGQAHAEEHRGVRLVGLRRTGSVVGKRQWGGWVACGGWARNSFGVVNEGQSGMGGRDRSKLYARDRTCAALPI